MWYALQPVSCKVLLEPLSFRMSETLSLKLSWKYFFEEQLSLYFLSLVCSASFCPSFLVRFTLSLPESQGVTRLLPVTLPATRVKLDYLAELNCLDEFRFFSWVSPEPFPCWSVTNLGSALSE